MAKLTDRFQPTFSLFPINNNRTGYQPVNLPLVLVVPFRRTIDGIPITGSQICNLTFSIEDAPGKVPVAGHKNIGVFVPDLERFRINISSAQLADVRIDPTGQVFYDAFTGAEKFFPDANPGDLMEYTQLRGAQGAWKKSGPGVRDRIPFFPDADYYDLSPFILETIDLPVGKYNFVYQGRYYKRIISPEGEFICLDTSDKVLTRFASFINHPGDVHQAMIKNTPAFYFESPSLDVDPTITFYRPFADALQDIFDEQELLKGINYVDTIPIQYIPYLSFLLGLDMPYFPSTTDEIRRALLRNGRKLQQLKGSRRAIRELFEIFGFTIDITNLWFSGIDPNDFGAIGEKAPPAFIGPNEPLPEQFDNLEITTEQVCHSEPLLNAYQTPGFGQFEVPLLFQPVGNITIDAWLVNAGSAADLALSAAVDATAADVEVFTTDNCALSIDGFQSSTSLDQSIPSQPIIGHSRILVDQEKGAIDEIQVGSEAPISLSGVSYNSDKNSIELVFDHFLPFDRNQVLYIFSTYERTKIILPADLEDLRSNRFDINVLLFKDGEQPSSDVFQFLLEFLFRFKAFHSLLRKIIFTVELDAIYNVSDYCVGGRQAQAPGNSAGDLQTPPPVLPSGDDLDDVECTQENIDKFFNTKDSAFRSKILELLAEEHRAWKDLDNTHAVPDELLPILQSATRLKINTPSGANCQFTQLGQDRVLNPGEKDFDHTEDDRDKLCDLENNVQDYCYKGRVQQEAEIVPIMTLPEIVRCKPCTLSGGVGTYYQTPLVKDSEFSGGDLGINAADLTDVSNYQRSRHDKNYVRIMAFDNPEIHYSDRAFLEDFDTDLSNRFFATQKPSLEVQKDNLGIPGHRFLSIAHQEITFTHPNYSLRPWDYLFDFVCPEDVPAGVMIPDLNPRLITGTGQDPDEFLIYDYYPLIYYGNGIPADIPQMGDHRLTAIPLNEVSHSIWSSASPGLKWESSTRTRYAVDQTNDGLKYPSKDLEEQKDIICFTDELGPIFESADRDCICPDVDNVYVARGTLLSGTSVTDSTSTTSTQGADFIDGYPAEFGCSLVDLALYDFPRETIEGYGLSVYGGDHYGDIGRTVDLGPAIALGMPIVAEYFEDEPAGFGEFGFGEGGFGGRESSPLERLGEICFYIDSGVRLTNGEVEYRFYQPHRLDCGCSKFDCEVDEIVESVTNAIDLDPLDYGIVNYGLEGYGGEVEEDLTGITTGPDILEPVPIVRCPIDFFQSPDGKIDWNCDRVVLTPNMILNDSYGAISCLMDGSIPNMMSFEDDKQVFNTVLTAFEQQFPEEGSYQFIDDYGIIHIGIFETNGDRLDITNQVRDPRVPGEPPTGEVKSFRTFRDGSITTDRQIIQVADFGFIIIAEGGNQELDRFQTTFGCGDETFADPFAFHLDANITDDVNIIMTPVLELTGTGTGTGTD